MKRFARVVSLTLVIMVMVFTVPFGTVPVYAATYSVTFGGGTTSGAHYATATDLTSFLGTLSSGDIVDITAVADITIDFAIEIPTGVSVTFKSDSTTRTLTRDSGYVGFLIDSKGDLTLENIVLDGNKGAVIAAASLVYVYLGSFTMNTGAVLQNNNNNGFNVGGGVYVDNGAFIMNGGSIVDNEAMAGGGVAVSSRGGVVVASGSFSMTSGTIAGNVATDAFGYGYGGGGVLAGDVTLNISGGTITGNTALLGAPGAGIMLDVFAPGCTLNLTGSPQIGTSNADNGVYVKAGSSITTNLSAGAYVNIDGIAGATAGSVVASRPSGVTTPVSFTEAAYFHYMPGGLSVIPNIGSNAYILGVPVSSIAVTGQGGATSITTLGGTLQMLASVLPVNATDKSVTWSVSGSAATISPNGILTAVSDGTVTVTATANDDSGVSGTKAVNISGQTPAQVPVYPFTTNFPTVTDNTQPVIGTIDADYVADYGSGTGSSVWVNGVQLTRGQDYTDASGSVVITLLPAYLQTLSNGTYPVTVNFANGRVANSTLVVNLPAVTTTNSALPQTGDNGLPMLWIVLCGIALAGTGLWIKRRKTDTV